MEEDRTSLRQNHRYGLPDGRVAVAVRYWDAGQSGGGAPYAGWCLLDDTGVNHFVSRSGAITTYEVPCVLPRLSDLVELGEQPWCAECDFGYDAACPH